MGLPGYHDVWVVGRSWVRAPAGVIVQVLIRFSLLKCHSIPNFKFGSGPRGEVSYIPSASSSNKAFIHVKNYAYSGKLL